MKNILNGRLHQSHDMIKLSLENSEREALSLILCQMKYGTLEEKKQNAKFIIDACEHYKEWIKNGQQTK